MVCVLGIQPLTVNYFTGTGNVKQGILLSLSRQGLLLIPMLLILPKFFGLNGVLFAGPVADFLAFLLSVTLISLNFKKLSKLKGQ